MFSRPLAVHAEWRLDPVTSKIKWAEDETQVLTGGGWGYYTPDFRWTSDLSWRNNATPTQPIYYKTQLQSRIVKDWWWRVAGRYSTAPTCDFRWAEVTLEKTLARPLAFRAWGLGEWRRGNDRGRLDDYDLYLLGARLRWRPLASFQWNGELTNEQKIYPSPPKSSAKTALSNEVTLRFNPHTLLGRWAESIRVYPENAWKNYHHRSLRLEWTWNIRQNTVFTANCGYNHQSQGSGKEGGKLQMTGILDYPSTREYKLSWLWSRAKAIAAYDPSLPEEDGSALSAAAWRIGVRWQDFTPPLTLRAEVFGEWEEGKLTGGWAARLQGIYRRIRWTLGLAPRGGFYPTAEKGYWVEIKYYLD